MSSDIHTKADLGLEFKRNTIEYIINQVKRKH